MALELFSPNFKNPGRSAHKLVSFSDSHKEGKNVKEEFRSVESSKSKIHKSSENNA